MTKSLGIGGKGRYAFLLFDSTMKVVIFNPENEKLLIQILELLLPGKHISGITFTDKEKHGLVISEKVVNFDMLCKDEDTGEEFLVEVQNAAQDSFQDRVLSYATYPIREQMGRRLARIRDGEKLDRMDYSLKPIYVLSLVNFALKHESEDALEENYISRYELRNRHNAELMTQSLNFVFVEMGRMKLGPEDDDKCNTVLEKFIFSLKHMHELDKCPDSFTEPIFKDLYRATELATMPIETREFYDHNMRTELDIIAQTDYAVRQGEARGEARGKAEGKAEVAKAMLKNGLPVEMVMSCTGLSKEEVEALTH